ncbi:hypothetical protein [Dongia rigui]|uniref:Uncharacterized protein n=1 Tax=Dongia rigui TaxID=940149 RepID=A0ABU5E0A2_9PROT|nr:hypothetical protein [Dongia rigui]MDY0872893.1 hypothetical protein [Dongia rigui]
MTMTKAIPIALAAALLLPGDGAADELPASRYPDLMRTYYDYGVAEYCGLVDMPVHNGFALLRGDQLARLRVGREDDRRTRIEAAKAVEYEYQDHGLSGNKTWCRTDGLGAVDRFTTYFRLRRLP